MLIEVLMNRVILICMLCLLNISSFGQKIRFTDSTNRWGVLEWDYSSGGPTYYPTLYNFSGDSIYNGHLYKVLQGGDVFFGEPSLVREDTILNKVYVVINDSEEVLMDYNLHIGDTISHSLYMHPHVYTRFYVFDIDSTMINGVWHKVWEFHLVAGTFSSSYFVIEGIGCLKTPLFTNYPEEGLMNFEVFCFVNHWTSPLVSPMVGGYFDNHTSCASLDVADLPVNKNVVLIPNPIDITSKIVFPYTIAKGNLRITNGLGQVVVNLPVTNKMEMVIGDRLSTPGVYYYRVTNNESQKVFSGTFVKQ